MGRVLERGGQVAFQILDLISVVFLGLAIEVRLELEKSGAVWLRQFTARFLPFGAGFFLGLGVRTFSLREQGKVRVHKEERAVTLDVKVPRRRRRPEAVLNRDA